MMGEQMIIYLSLTVVAATPLILAALGGVMSERAGVVNIALEGIMLTSAFVGFVVAAAVHNLWLGLIAAILAGMLIASLHAVLSISFFVDQIVSGMVINILALGITGVFYRTFLQQSTTRGPGTLPEWDIPVLSQIPVLGPIFFQHQVVTYGALVLVAVAWFVLFRTVWGLRTRAVGEHPLAADTVGINVYVLRYGAVLASGLLSGLAGAFLSIGIANTFVPGMTDGRGYIALAAMIFGKWHPVGALLACLLFAGADALAARLNIAGINIPGQFLSMLPYLVTIVVVAGAMGRAVPPAADGKPYRKA